MSEVRNESDMPDRIWVRRDVVTPILGPFEVSSVADPEGLAAVEPGWHPHVPAAVTDERVERAHRVLFARGVGGTDDFRRKVVREVLVAALDGGDCT